jgi:hypothetical protein
MGFSVCYDLDIITLLRLPFSSSQHFGEGIGREKGLQDDL